MTSLRFYVTTSLSVIFLMLSLLEGLLYHSVENELAEQRDHQSKAGYAEQVDVQTNQILTRATAEALHDPALMEILKLQGIKFHAITSPQTTEPAPLTLPAPSTNTPNGQLYP